MQSSMNEENMCLEDSDIEYIKRQYLCCHPINKFKFTESHRELDGPIDLETQIKIYKSTIEDIGSMKYPSKLSYRRAFLRNLIEKLPKDEEIFDKIYETFVHYTMDNDQDNTTHYRQFLFDQEDTMDRIVLQESKHLISDGTTGLHTWQAGFALAEWCYFNKSKVNDKLVLELGSGTGLTGLSVITTCSPKRYTFSDCHYRVLDMLVKNVRLNCTSGEDYPVKWDDECYKTTYRRTDVQIKRLEWSSINDYDVDDSWENPNVVLAADVIYDERIFDDLIAVLSVFIKRSNALVIIAATVRNEDTLAAFLTKLGIHGLSYEDETVPKPRLFLHLDETPVRILRIFTVK